MSIFGIVKIILRMLYELYWLLILMNLDKCWLRSLYVDLDESVVGELCGWKMILGIDVRMLMRCLFF